METTENVVEGQVIAPSGLQPVSAEEQVYNIPVSKIVFSPLNYRGFYDEQALDEFADQLGSGEGEILHAIIVRPKGRKYELIVGERRFRAAQKAGLKEIQGKVKVLSDDQVRKIQFIENHQREDPHPLREAARIRELMDAGLTLVEAAQTLGKSKAYVHSRVKLTELIEPLQEVYFAGKLTMNEAIELGSLATDSQEDFFAQHCTGWKENKHFYIDDVGYLVKRYKLDLTRAPFNIKDKKLILEVGPCTTCPFNSATLKTLFPEFSKEAVCSNKTCFASKCRVAAEQRLLAALTEFQPEAILLSYYVDREFTSLLETLPEAAGLPRYNAGEVTVLTEPEKPDRKDYQVMDEEKEKLVFDRERYGQAVSEYKEDLAAHKQKLGDEATLRGIQLRNSEITFVYLNPAKASGDSAIPAQQATAKAVQQAIKEGTATTELLSGEIERIKEREQRFKELDQVKVQERVHHDFCAAVTEETLQSGLTEADIAAMHFILYNSLSYGGKEKAMAKLFPKGCKDNKKLFEKLGKLSDEQVAFLVRLSIGFKSESKSVRTMEARCLYEIAGADGLDVAAIEAEQAEVAVSRWERAKERIKDLQARIRKLKSGVAA